MLMNFKKQNTITEIEYNLEIWNIKKNPIKTKSNSEHHRYFQNSIGSSLFFVFICRASWICWRSLSISRAVIMVFSTRIFGNLDLAIERVLRCKALALKSLRCIVSRLKRVVVVRPTYVLFSLETQFPKGYLNINKTFVLSRNSVEMWELW